MSDFTSTHNGKEIVFTKEGIRYNNQAYIRYDDMEEVAINDTDLVFKYKGHLIRMPFAPGDASAIEEFFKTPEPEPIQPTNSLDLELDQFSYLNNTPVEAPKKEKKSKVGLIIGILVAIAAVAVAAIILL